MSGFFLSMPTVSKLNAKLNYVQERHNVLTQNIANVETPGYRAQEVKFEGLIHNLAFDDNSLRSYEADAVMVDSKRGVVKENGNDVSLEHEMVQMTDNSLEFMMTTAMIKKNLALMKYAVAESR